MKKINDSGQNNPYLCRMHLDFFASSAFLTLSIAIASSPAQAQAIDTTRTTVDDAANSSYIEEIVVTAQKREERLQRVPITITALTGAKLAQSGIQTTEDLPRLTSGLTTNRSVSAGNYFFPFIRGVGSAINSNGIEASVATYLDGVYQADKQSNILDLEGVERIEVLKGPQGTLFGRNATGGAISIITAVPTDTFAAHGSASFGRFDETVERGYLNGPLAPNLYANVAIVARQGGDFLYNIPTNQKFGGTRSTVVNAKLKWEPDDRFNATASFIYARRSTSDVGVSLTSVDGTVPLAVNLGGTTSYQDYRTNLTTIPTGRSDGYQGALTARYSFGSVDLVSITSRQIYKPYNLLDYDQTEIKLFTFVNDVRTDAWTQEVQLVSTSAGRFQWVAGGYFIDQMERYVPLSYLYSGPNGTPVDIRADAGTRGEAAFAQGTLGIGESTHLTAGLRYSHERKTVTGTTVLPALGNLIVAGPIDLAKSFSKLTWRISLDHQFSNDIMGFVSYNRGFKSGGFNSNDFTPQQPIAPEVLDAYEAGLKTQLLDRTVQLNGSVYYYEYKNIQVSRVGDNGGSVLQSAGAAKLYGVDVELVYRPVQSLQFNAGLNWMHTEYTKFENASGFSLSSDGMTAVATIFPSLKGEQLLNAPDLTFNVGATYTARFGNGGSLEISPVYSYNSKYKQIPGDVDIVTGQGFLNASMTWHLPGDHFTIGLWGKNLTDVHSLGTNPTVFGISRQTFRPRTVGVTAGFKL